MFEFLKLFNRIVNLNEGFWITPGLNVILFLCEPRCVQPVQWNTWISQSSSSFHSHVSLGLVKILHDLYHARLLRAQPLPVTISRQPLRNKKRNWMQLEDIKLSKDTNHLISFWSPFNMFNPMDITTNTTTFVNICWNTPLLS